MRLAVAICSTYTVLVLHLHMYVPLCIHLLTQYITYYSMHGLPLHLEDTLTTSLSSCHLILNEKNHRRIIVNSASRKNLDWSKYCKLNYIGLLQFQKEKQEIAYKSEPSGVGGKQLWNSSLKSNDISY